MTTEAASGSVAEISARIVAGDGYGSIMANVSLAELIALLAYDNDGLARGTDAHLDYGLAGALLIDLALAGRIDVAGRYIVVTNPAPTGDRLMDFALHRLQHDRRAREPRDWIIRFTKDVRAAVLSQLIDAGTLGRETDKMLKVFPRTRYPTHDGSEPPAKAEARRQIRAAATQPDHVDARTMALCGLVSALGWEPHVVPDLPPMQVRNRFAEFRRSVWAANAVQRIIDDARAASTAAATAAGATA
ncbi:GPP34 family phosphoprotein [Micromonospora sp. NBC_01699]|uniref:GOLPH3/VPS74 family protein n=1 Tax=Micromonospora sp. NBC_01699 TaxID=2975984 RepID=UPI002E2E179D|nr:GPP34 family phosphoprotein [Micromonospora sp. NBC_01699]